MNNSKSNTAPTRGRAKGRARGGQAAQASNPAATRQAPQPAAQAGDAARPGTVDDAIAKAQHGRVNVSPARAVEMAGQLYSRGKFAQAERVCRQIIRERPANADAHNILGVTIAAAGKTDEAVDSLKRAIKLNPKAASYHANLGEILRQAGKARRGREGARSRRSSSIRTMPRR